MIDVRLTPVRQHVSTESVADVAAEVRAGLRALPLSQRVRPGMRVALALPSRGISCIEPVVRTVVEELRALDAQPFLVPAMGSHGGGTAEGQQEVLESYGLGEAALGAPIQSCMDSVPIGETPAGMPVYFDTHAAQADGIIAVNRIKEHTAFKGQWESGLMKIIAVGLGKGRGAAEIHNWGLRDAMPAAARVVLARKPILAGIGIVENGLHQPARIAVLPTERIEAEEPALLDLARRLRPGIPFEPLDLLIVEEMGKDISGTGMDLNVIGMWRRVGGPISPVIHTIVALDLTPNSHGNAIGVGFADLITQRLRDKIDVAATYTTLPTDREAIAAGLVGIAPAQARVALIRNTLSLDTLWVSEALLPTVAATPGLEQLGPPRPLTFDIADTLRAPNV
jgi:hypothetical protein